MLVFSRRLMCRRTKWNGSLVRECAVNVLFAIVPFAGLTANFKTYRNPNSQGGVEHNIDTVVSYRCFDTVEVFERISNMSRFFWQVVQEVKNLRELVTSLTQECQSVKSERDAYYAKSANLESIVKVRAEVKHGHGGHYT